MIVPDSFIIISILNSVFWKGTDNGLGGERLREKALYFLGLVWLQYKLETKAFYQSGLLRPNSAWAWTLSSVLVWLGLRSMYWRPRA